MEVYKCLLERYSTIFPCQRHYVIKQHTLSFLCHHFGSFLSTSYVLGFLLLNDSSIQLLFGSCPNMKFKDILKLQTFSIHEREEIMYIRSVKQKMFYSFSQCVKDYQSITTYPFRNATISKPRKYPSGGISSNATS